MPRAPAGRWAFTGNTYGSIGYGWVPTFGDTRGFVWSADLALDPLGAPVLLYEEYSSDAIVLTRFRGGVWQTVERFVFPNIRFPQLLVDARGAAVCLFVSTAAGPNDEEQRSAVVAVRLPDSLGSGLHYLGGSAGFVRTGWYVRMALTPDGRPAVVHEDVAGDGSLAVQTWGGTMGALGAAPTGAWQRAGGASPICAPSGSGGMPSWPDIAVSRAASTQGTIYVAFADPAQSEM